MQYNQLGRTDMKVSRICLGTMTYGEQNSQDEGSAQMDMALEMGVNFFDTAEMYSVPAKAETQGSTESVIGNWFAERKNRDKVILATKITGPGDGFTHVRDNDLSFGPKQIETAIEMSLKRLKTDYIDLYQLHWPERSTGFVSEKGFESSRGFTFHKEDQWTKFEVVLEGLSRAMKAGKVRAVGCSNETPWGLMKLLATAEQTGLPRMESVQNRYSLLSRQYENGLGEVSLQEDCGLLAYSPLAFGILSGKYLNGAKPENGRLTLFPDYDRFRTSRGITATQAYVDLAKEHGLDPSQMALAYVNTRAFTTSNIIGATTLKQLESNILSDDVVLSDEVLEGIEKIHLNDPNPKP